MPVVMDFVSSHIQAAGFSHFGWTELSRPLTIDLYREWLEQGLHANMNYLREHLPLKETPQRLAPRARSAIVIAKPYYPHPYAVSAPNLNLKSGLYSLGEDYHMRFKEELEDLCDGLRKEFVDQEFLCCTDSAPVLERDLAYKAGLGWIGKNTCLIHPDRGSLFFIGEILTSLASPHISPTPVMADFCGTCDRCIQACPTQALKPRQLDATKCISYWTIEARDSAPVELRAKFGEWFFGCDVCQTVCPWNEKAFGFTKKPLSTPPREEMIQDLRWILTTSKRQLMRELNELPLTRARGSGLKRNALYVIGNLRIYELREEVQNLRQEESLNELIDWTLQQLDRESFVEVSRP